MEPTVELRAPKIPLDRITFAVTAPCPRCSEVLTSSPHSRKFPSSHETRFPMVCYECEPERGHRFTVKFTLTVNLEVVDG